MSEALVDPTGSVLVLIRDDSAVDAIVHGRVRGGEPAAGDALGPGHYQPFVVLTRLGRSRLKRAPVQEVRLNAACYGVTHQGAAALAGAVSSAVHPKGPRISAGGVAIWSSFDDGGGDSTKDPDTGQPREDFVIAVNASTVLSDAGPVTT